MKTIYLRRQGCSKILNTNNHFDLDYHISIHPWQQTDKYIAEICYSNNQDEWQDKRGQVAFTIGKNNAAYDLITIKRLIEKGIFEHFEKQVHISNVTERYCYEWNTYDYCKNDIYFTCCIYEPYSNLIRLLFNNHCLVDFNSKGTDQLFGMDPASKFFPILKKCAECYEKEQGYSCNKDKPDIYFKGFFIWILSERLKEQFPLLPVFQYRSLIKGVAA